jgi:hemerythrin-like domain-containing protein
VLALRAAHAYEEEVVFPAFQTTRASASSTDRLKTEHMEDECSAEQLTEVLLAVGHGGAVPNPEATGFMLRAFFMALRRHIAFERDHILPFLASVEEGDALDCNC